MNHNRGGFRGCPGYRSMLHFRWDSYIQVAPPVKTPGSLAHARAHTLIINTDAREVTKIHRECQDPFGNHEKSRCDNTPPTHTHMIMYARAPTHARAHTRTRTHNARAHTRPFHPPFRGRKKIFEKILKKSSRGGLWCRWSGCNTQSLPTGGEKTSQKYLRSRNHRPILLPDPNSDPNHPTRDRRKARESRDLSQLKSEAERSRFRFVVADHKGDGIPGH